MLRPNGVILVDNMLFDGRVIDLAEQGDNVQGIREFNDHVTRRRAGRAACCWPSATA